MCAASSVIVPLEISGPATKLHLAGPVAQTQPREKQAV
jgi:hypothetical protein